MANAVDQTMPQNVQFTSDEIFKELQDKDETTEITAYVDEVHAPTIVGGRIKYDLFKFVVNNGANKRIVCLVWGKTLIEKYVNEIKIGKIVHIEGGETKAVAINYYKESNTLVPFEILIKQDATTVEYLGEYNLNVNNQIDLGEIQETNFDNIGKAHGLVSIQGNIKMKFVKTYNKRQKEYCGIGSITDGSAKVKIQIANYAGLMIEKGVLVKVIGEIDEEAAMVTIICSDESAIVTVAGAPVMAPDQVARGVKSPKRGIV